jgi:hypothetical protein
MSMSTEDLVICPECGGIVGATEVTDQGKPCTCIIHSPKGDTSVFGQAVVPKTKVCCICGKDLAGRKRLRDSRGYWCVDCHKADQAANAPKGVKCGHCARVVAEAALSDFNGVKVCGICRKDLAEQAKRDRQMRGVDSKAYQEHDKLRLYVMIGIAGVLLVIIILHSLKLLGRF